MMIGEFDDPSCLSFSENIDESPSKRDKAPTAKGDEDPHSHFKIYEFNYNEHNAKSVISSTDRKKPAGVSQGIGMTINQSQSNSVFIAGGLNIPNQQKEPQKQKAYDIALEDDERLFELEIKNLDTNEVFKMHIPIANDNKGSSSHRERKDTDPSMEQSSNSKRKKAIASSGLRFVRFPIIVFLTLGRCD